jgi:hypothetical protein
MEETIQGGSEFDAEQGRGYLFYPSKTFDYRMNSMVSKS